MNPSVSLYSDEERSTDGSDSEGSLVDFIVKDDDDDEDTIEQMPEVDEATMLQESFPYEKELLQEKPSTGPRRSKRKRKAVTRYQDPSYSKLMYDDVDVQDVLKSSSENEQPSEDSAFEVSDDESGDSSDDSSVEHTNEGDFAFDE
jgi:hypothetical protein